MKRTLPILAMALAGSVSAAPPVQQWTWEGGKQKNNEPITIKSTAGSATYSGTKNPTGDAAKPNQTVATQPPTIIVKNQK